MPRGAKQQKDHEYTLTLEDLCLMLRFSRQAAYELCKQGKFPVYRFGPRTIRIPKEPFLCWLKTNRYTVKLFRVLYKSSRSCRHAAIKNGDLTKEQWIAMQNAYNHRCAYCGKCCKGKLTQDHIEPLIHGGKHTYTNIVPACKHCNSKKHTGPVLCPVQPMLLL